MATTMKRTAAVKILLSPNIDQQLRDLAERLGQSPATLASMAVSQWVAQQHNSLGASERAVEGFFERLAGDLSPDLKRLLLASSDDKQGAPLAGGQPVAAHVPRPPGAAPDPYSLIHGNKVGKQAGEAKGSGGHVDGPPAQLRIEEAGHGKSPRPRR